MSARSKKTKIDEQQLRNLSARILRAAATGGTFDPADVEKFRHAAKMVSPWDNILEQQRIVNKASVRDWRERLKRYENKSTVERYLKEAPARAEARRRLRSQELTRISGLPKNRDRIWFW